MILSQSMELLVFLNIIDGFKMQFELGGTLIFDSIVFEITVGFNEVFI